MPDRTTDPCPPGPGWKRSVKPREARSGLGYRASVGLRIQRPARVRLRAGRAALLALALSAGLTGGVLATAGRGAVLGTTSTAGGTTALSAAPTTTSTARDVLV